MRESELLGHIYERSRDLTAAFGDVVVGPGDDCAVVRTNSGDLLLVTTDQLIEGRHFEPDTPIDLIARKAIARSLSDIAAMGGSPSWGLATAALPKGYEHADALFDAMAKWGRHWSCPLVGGDIAMTDGPLVLSTTVIGRLDVEAIQAIHPHSPAEADTIGPVLRSGARVSDNVYVSGRLGNSFQSGHHLSFEPRIAVGRYAAWDANCVHAMIDISDGLGRDAARVGRQSGVCIEIEASRVPLRDGSSWHDALTGGEDYELLIVGSVVGGTHDRPTLMGAPECQMWPIGKVVPASGDEYCVVIDPYGKRHRADDLGWDHKS